jgi:intracellular sulfur oxidation DsrE/DsrF family protein
MIFHLQETAMTTTTSRRTMLAASLLPVIGLLPAAAALAQTASPARKHRLLINVSDNDPAKWNMILNNAKNAQDDVGGADKIDIEIVAYGPGIYMVKGDSPVGSRIDEIIKGGVKVVGCENTMKTFKLDKAEMRPTIGYVPAAVTEIMRRQEEGWAYVRP